MKDLTTVLGKRFHAFLFEEMPTGDIAVAYHGDLVAVITNHVEVSIRSRLGDYRVLRELCELQMYLKGQAAARQSLSKAFPAQLAEALKAALPELQMEGKAGRFEVRGESGALAVIRGGAQVTINTPKQFNTTALQQIASLGLLMEAVSDLSQP